MRLIQLWCHGYLRRCLKRQILSNKVFRNRTEEVTLHRGALWNHERYVPEFRRRIQKIRLRVEKFRLRIRKFRTGKQKFIMSRQKTVKQNPVSFFRIVETKVGCRIRLVRRVKVFLSFLNQSMLGRNSTTSLAGHHASQRNFFPLHFVTSTLFLDTKTAQKRYLVVKKRPEKSKKRQHVGQMCLKSRTFAPIKNSINSEVRKRKASTNL